MRWKQYRSSFRGWTPDGNVAGTMAWSHGGAPSLVDSDIPGVIPGGTRPVPPDRNFRNEIYCKTRDWKLATFRWSIRWVYDRSASAGWKRKGTLRWDTSIY